MRVSWPTSRLGWAWAKVRRRLWFRLALFAIAAVASALLAGWAAPYVPRQLSDRVREGAARQILTIMASSMLVVATFSIGTMVQAFGAAAQIATPRATVVLIDDPFSQSVLSTFLGAFVFSMVALIGHSVSYYGPGGEVVLLGATTLVVAVVIGAFFGWLDHLINMGRLNETMRKVERRAADALAAVAAAPHLGGVAPRDPAPEHPVTSDETAYVCHLDLGALQHVARNAGGRIRVAALPGAFAGPSRPLVLADWKPSDEECEAIRAAFSLEAERNFEQDPRFGLAVLTEIASRALSPGINDPGTAIGVISAQQRLLTDWARAEPGGEEPSCPDVEAPSLAVEDMFQDAFGPLLRDAAPNLEVGIRLQKTLGALAVVDPGRFAAFAAEYSARALDHAGQALVLADDRARLAATAPH
jgi:uncharacterized membrane protein